MSRIPAKNTLPETRVADALRRFRFRVTSTPYHALPHGRAKRVFMTLDHSAIYIFIAGSYTPFALGALNGPWG